MEAFPFARAARRRNISISFRVAYWFALAVAAILLTAAPSPAKQKPISGKLSKKGYTVVALAENGKASSVKAKSGAFKIIPPAAKVTLQLRAPDGTYAGPVVVGGTKKSVITGVKAGAKLGLVKVKSGYAVARVAPRDVSPSIAAQGSKGAPLGAGVFGRVKSSKHKSAGAGRDADRDGIPGAFDVDDDGDLLLDNFEKSGAKVLADPLPPAGPPPPGGATPPGGASSDSFKVFSNLKLDMERSLNANAGGVTDAQIDAAVSGNATLAIQVAGSDVELDCGGLTYCSSGGTGRSMEGNKSFPSEFDSDADGMGSLTAGSTGDFQLLTGATASQIGSGDAMIEHVTTGGATTQVPGILNYIFSTTPALKSWTTGAGGNGTATYPVAPGMLGTQGNPITVGNDGMVTMTFWRPQRKAIEGSGEGTGWVDIGHLRYTADVPNSPSSGSGSPGQGPGNCAAATYSTSDPNLTIGSQSPQDNADDKAADAANTLTFSVNLVQCLAAKSIVWSSGQTLSVDIQAVSEFGDNAAQKIFFKMT